MPVLTGFRWDGRRARAARLTAILVAAAGITLTAAGPWPPLRQGMWEVTRVMPSAGGGAPRSVSAKRCTDPASDWQRQAAALAKVGCTMSAVTQRGNAYSFTASCKVQGLNSTTTTTIVTQGDSAYSLTVEGQTDGQPTKERASARRIGDCTR